ncbi:hypothetical protein AVEN_240960-1 [Araneus ventricosus]|uniref:Secreted protein n=1 Tax=Araneus ventricosus TaxID=182803 RepID=A0A4Y2K468_ARAVE|nr:hypothetical protein AVEN_240960-1 [Araneus ventricosus]
MCSLRLAGKLFFVSLMYGMLNFGADCSATSRMRSEGQECIDILPPNYRMQDIPKPPGVFSILIIMK